MSGLPERMTESQLRALSERAEAAASQDRRELFNPWLVLGVIGELRRLRERERRLAARVQSLLAAQSQARVEALADD